MSDCDVSQAENQYDYRKPEFHKKCHDCGQFMKRELWVAKDHRWKKHALCVECLSNYDCPGDM